MKVHIQLCLYIAAAVALLWGVGLFMQPETVHGLFSNGPYDSAATAMFGASLFAFALLFFTAALYPVNPLVYASVSALALLSITALFQMYIGSGMPRNGLTFLSLLIYGVMALILFFSLVQPPAVAARGRMPARAHGSARPAARQRRAKAARPRAARKRR